MTPDEFDGWVAEVKVRLAGDDWVLLGLMFPATVFADNEASNFVRYLGGLAQGAAAGQDPHVALVARQVLERAAANAVGYGA